MVLLDLVDPCIRHEEEAVVPRRGGLVGLHDRVHVPLQRTDVGDVRRRRVRRRHVNLDLAHRLFKTSLC